MEEHSITEQDELNRRDAEIKRIAGRIRGEHIYQLLMQEKRSIWALLKAKDSQTYREE